MTSSSPLQKSDQGGRTDTSGGRHCLNNPAMVKVELRQSIIAKRQARGEKQLKIEYREPQQMALSPVEVEKKERRREQNRRAAQRCRHKKRINQKHVIQNYEQVVARNEELELELDAVKRELNKLRNTWAHHYMCCPSFSKVKPETDHGIKLEPLCVDELHNDNTQLSVRSQEYSRNQTNGANTFVYSNGSGKFATSSGALECGTSTFSDKRQEIVAVEPETDFLQPPHSHSADTDQEHQWRYTGVADVTNSPNARMLSGLSPDLAAFLMSAQHYVNNNKYSRHQRQDYELQPQEQIIIENTGSNQPPEPVDIPRMPSTEPVSTQRYTFLDCGGQVQAQYIACQVVPSLRSPRPDSVTSTTSCSYDTLRHRSLSGGSGCVSHPPRRDREISSVSSEGSLSIGSMHQDWSTLEVPDMDTDDVFSNPTNGPGLPLDGHDDNNNIESLPDNNITMENELLQFITQTSPSVINWLSTAPESANAIRDDAARANDTSNGIIDAEDGNPLLQFPSEYLQLLTNDIENGDQSASEILSNILSAAQSVDAEAH